MNIAICQSFSISINYVFKQDIFNIRGIIFNNVANTGDLLCGNLTKMQHRFEFRRWMFTKIDHQFCWHFPFISNPFFQIGIIIPTLCFPSYEQNYVSFFDLLVGTTLAELPVTRFILRYEIDEPVDRPIRLLEPGNKSRWQWCNTLSRIAPVVICSS